MMTIKIAVRNIFRHKARTFITLSAIVFGCVALIFAAGFLEDVFYIMRESYIKAHTGHIQLYRRGFSEKGRLQPYQYLIDKPGAIIARIKSIEGVDFVTSRLEFSGLLSNGENTISFIGQGIEPQYEKTLLKSETTDFRQLAKNNSEGSPIMKAGSPLAPTDKYAIVLGQGLAASIDAKSGDSLTLLTNTVHGSTNALDVTVKGIFETSAKVFDDHFLRLPLTTAQKLLSTESVQSLVIRLKKTEDTARVKEQLVSIIQQDKLDLELKTWDEISDFYTKTVILFDKFFFVMKLTIIIVVISGIFNTMNMAVMERISEIGTIMALGVKKRGVISLFLWEGALLGTIGGIIGVIAGVVFTSIISYIGIVMPPPPGATVYWLNQPMIVPLSLVYTFLMALIISIISSLYPAYKASRLQITEALRYR